MRTYRCKVKTIKYAEVVVFAKSNPRIYSWVTKIYYPLFI